MNTTTKPVDQSEESTHCTNCAADLLVCNVYMQDGDPFCDIFCAEQFKGRKARESSVVPTGAGVAESIPPEKKDSIKLKMDSKGHQYWDINMSFDRGTEDPDDVVAEIEHIDKKMRETFGDKAD